LNNYKNKNPKKSICDYPKAETIRDNSVMFKPCDILIPAALERSINRHNADKLNCKIIIEGANGPTTMLAD